jgi:hypothetical protein
MVEMLVFMPTRRMFENVRMKWKRSAEVAVSK